MAQPYVGEIRIFAGNFAPAGWMFCEGQTLPISQNETLFQLIGTTYGGDGQSTFRLPDLRGRLPLHMGNGSTGTTYTIGQTAGAESVTLTTQQIPAHSHPLLASLNNAGASSPANNLTGQVGATQIYREAAPTNPMSPVSVAPVGGSQPHDNRQPFLCLHFIISLFGIFPSQT
jgi:microcystin-dependent protein